MELGETIERVRRKYPPYRRRKARETLEAINQTRADISRNRDLKTPYHGEGTSRSGESQDQTLVNVLQDKLKKLRQEYGKLNPQRPQKQ